MDGLPRLYTLREVADSTGFSLSGLQRDCVAGRIAHVHRGRARLMTAEQVVQLVRDHVREPVAVDELARTRRRVEKLIARKRAQGG